jgi:hypothetical protein
MTPGQALGLARGAARWRQLRYADPHAYERMQERDVSRRDVAEAIMTSTSVLPDPARVGRFRLVGGTDHSGDPLDVVIAVDGRVVTVVTVLEGTDP